MRGVKVEEAEGLTRTRWGGNEVIDYFLCEEGMNPLCTIAREEHVSDHMILENVFEVSRKPCHDLALNFVESWDRPSWISAKDWRTILQLTWERGERQGWQPVLNFVEEIGPAISQAGEQDDQAFVDRYWTIFQAKLSTVFSDAYSIALQNMPGDLSHTCKDILRVGNVLKKLHYKLGATSVKKHNKAKIFEPTCVKVRKRLGRCCELKWKIKKHPDKAGHV